MFESVNDQVALFFLLVKSVVYPCSSVSGGTKPLTDSGEVSGGLGSSHHLPAPSLSSARSSWACPTREALGTGTAGGKLGCGARWGTRRGARHGIRLSWAWDEWLGERPGELMPLPGLTGVPRLRQHAAPSVCLSAVSLEEKTARPWGELCSPGSGLPRVWVCSVLLLTSFLPRPCCWPQPLLRKKSSAQQRRFSGCVACGWPGVRLVRSWSSFAPPSWLRGPSEARCPLWAIFYPM